MAYWEQDEVDEYVRLDFCVFLRKIIKLVYVAYDYSDDNEMIVV